MVHFFAPHNGHKYADMRDSTIHFDHFWNGGMMEWWIGGMEEWHGNGRTVWQNGRTTKWRDFMMTHTFQNTHMYNNTTS